MTTADPHDTATLTYGDVVVLDYLAALWAESEDLDPDLRDELMTTVTQYVALRRTAADPLHDPIQIVGRLGPPEALVAAARRGHLPPHLRLPAPAVPPPQPAPAAVGPAEYTAVGLLTGGAFVLPVVGPFAGMLVASGSPHWTPAQKATGWVLTAGSPGLGMILLLGGSAAGLNSLAVLLAILAVVGGPIAAAIALLPGLRDR